MPLLILSCLSVSWAASAVSGGDMAEFSSILQGGYVGEKNLSWPLTGRVEDWVQSSQGRIQLGPTPAAGSASPPITLQVLPDDLVYFRLRSFFVSRGWDDFAVQVHQALSQVSTGVILDLRSNRTPDDYEGAARLAGLFLPSGTSLFTIRDAKGETQNYQIADSAWSHENVFAGPVIVLIDHQTAGAAEALAAVLQAHGDVTMGGTTSGNGALFATHTLSSGRILRYISGEVTLADGTPLWRHAVTPDVGIPLDAKKAAAALEGLDQNRLNDFIQEAPSSHRLSESALVHGEDPELDAYLVVPAASGPAGNVPQDSVLVAALDSLKAIRISHEAPVLPPVAGAPSKGSPR